MPWSDYAANAVLNAVIGKTSSFGALATAPTLYLGLLTSYPQPANNGAAVSEANYTGYARVAVAAAAWNAASGRIVTNSGTINFGQCTAGSSVVTAIGIFDASTPALAAPVISSATQGGTAGSTIYRYVLTATNATGETVGSAEVNVTNGNATLSVANPITVNWTQITGATGYKLYRTAANGGTGSELFLATIGSGSTVTYTDNGSATPTGSAPPTTNTTGGNLISFGELMNPQTISAGNLTLSGTTATVNLTAHGFSVGQSVLITGCEQPEYNGWKVIVTVADANHFTFAVGNAPVSPATAASGQSMQVWAATTLGVTQNSQPVFNAGAIAMAA